MDLKTNIDFISAHIIGIQETFLNEKLTVERCHLPGFHPIKAKCRPRGGVAIYVKNSLQFAEINLPSLPIDCICIAIDSPRLIICTLDVPLRLPKVTIEKCIADIINILPHGIYTIIAGDFNHHLEQSNDISYLIL